MSVTASSADRSGLTPTERAALVAVAVQFFVNGTSFASFIPRLPEVRDAIDVSLDRLGLLSSLAAVAGLAGNLAVSRVIERLGSRGTIAVCGTVLSCALPLIGFAEAQWMFLAGLMLMMAVDVMVDVAMNLQGSWLSARRHAPVMNRLHGLWSLGSLTGGVVGVVLSNAGVSLRIHLLFAAAVLLVSQVGGSRWMLRNDDAYRHRASGESTSAPGASTRRPQWLALVGLGALGFGGVALEVTPGDWAAFRFTDDLGTSEGFAALGFVAVAGGMTVGRFAGDWVAHRTTPQRLSRLAMATALAGIGIATLVPDRFVSLLGFLIAGLGASTLLPTLYDRAAKRPGRAGAGLGALTAGLRVGLLTVPVVTGALADTALDVGVSVAIVAAVAGALFIAADAAATRTARA